MLLSSENFWSISYQGSPVVSTPRVKALFPNASASSVVTESFGLNFPSENPFAIPRLWAVQMYRWYHIAVSTSGKHFSATVSGIGVLLARRSIVRSSARVILFSVPYRPSPYPLVSHWVSRLSIESLYQEYSISVNVANTGCNAMTEMSQRTSFFVEFIPVLYPYFSWYKVFLWKFCEEG